MVSPAATCHSTISASAMPSPTSGSFTTYSLISCRHYPLQCRAHTRGPREVVPLLRMWVRSVPTRHTLDRRLELVETQFLHGCRELGSEATRAGCLVHNDAPPGLTNRFFDGVCVEWQQGAQVDDLPVDPRFVHRGFGDVHHGSVRQHCDVVARPPYRRLTELDLVVAVGHLTQRVARPWHDRVV